MILKEDTILALLRDALGQCESVWTGARYFPADDAERTDKVIVAGGRTTDFGETLAALHGAELRPYGVHHHTLIVGWRPLESEVRIDTSRFRERTR